MLKYKFELNGTDENIVLPISLESGITHYEAIENLIEEETLKVINPIVNNEKEYYEPVTGYNINFRFYNGVYSNQWTEAGFNLTTEKNKNVFKKSKFYLEFYNDNTKTNNILFTTTMMVYPNSESGKGCDEVAGIPVTTFTVDKVKNELFLLYFNRSFDGLSNVKTENGKRYVSIFMKAMFLNAKTGKIHYFLNTDNDNILKSQNYNTSLQYHEIRFYENYKYAFYKNNVQQNSVILREMVIK